LSRVGLFGCVGLWVVVSVILRLAELTYSTYIIIAPNVSSVSPPNGPAAGGYPITIIGSQFGPPDSPVVWVTIDGYACENVTWISYEQLEV
jgi:IPT/TIG domain